MGPGEGRSLGRSLQVVRRAGAAAGAGPAAHHVAGRADAAHGIRRRQADQDASFRRLEGPGRAAYDPGRLGCRVGRRRARRHGRHDEGDDVEPEVRVPAQERRALQRKREPHRILRADRAAGRHPAPGRDDRDDRPRVPAAALRDHVTFQERAGRREVESDRVLSNVVAEVAGLE